MLLWDQTLHRRRGRRISKLLETGAEAKPSQWLGEHCRTCAQCTETMRALCAPSPWAMRVEGDEDLEAKRAEAASDALDAMTPLIQACLSGRTECVRELLQEPSVDVDFADADGHTALHAASAFGHTECVELLIKAGARLDTPDKEGATPLDGARMNESESSTQCASLLVDAGCLWAWRRSAPEEDEANQEPRYQQPRERWLTK